MDVRSIDFIMDGGPLWTGEYKYQVKVGIKTQTIAIGIRTHICLHNITDIAKKDAVRKNRIENSHISLFKLVLNTRNVFV